MYLCMETEKNSKVHWDPLLSTDDLPYVPLKKDAAPKAILLYRIKPCNNKRECKTIPTRCASITISSSKLRTKVLFNTSYKIQVKHCTTLKSPHESYSADKLDQDTKQQPVLISHTPSNEHLSQHLEYKKCPLSIDIQTSSPTSTYYKNVFARHTFPNYTYAHHILHGHFTTNFYLLLKLLHSS